MYVVEETQWILGSEVVMTLEVCHAKCNQGCDANLLRDPDILGDYFEGILHKWCPECGLMFGPMDFDIKEISKNSAKKIANNIAEKFNLNVVTSREVAVSFAPSLDPDIFAINFTLQLGNVTGRRVPLNAVVREVLSLR
jgi:hypothetical protein